MVACVVEDRADSREWNNLRAKFEGHLNKRRKLVEVTKRRQCDIVFVLLNIFLFIRSLIKANILEVSQCVI